MNKGGAQSRLPGDGTRTGIRQEALYLSRRYATREDYGRDLTNYDARLKDQVTALVKKEIAKR